MASRVTDELVQSFLTWGRNYGEIESFSKVAPSGRKWRIRIAVPATADGGDGHSPLDNILGPRTDRFVPQEFVLTSREALTFGYGLAVGGAHETRREFAAREWGWDR